MGDSPERAALELGLLRASRPYSATDIPPKVGSIVIDRFGDTWERGLVRWICQTPVDGTRLRAAAASGDWAALAGPDRGPVRLLREGRDGLWLYETIQPRTAPNSTVEELWPSSGSGTPPGT